MKKRNIWNRHPFFYKVKYKLLLKNIKLSDLTKINYNNHNKLNSIPEVYFKYNNEIVSNNDLPDLEKAILIGKWLRNNIEGGPGLGIDSKKSLMMMLESKCGICSDFSQVFNNFCVVNKILVREWGLIHFDLIQGGHSFNEIYSKELKKWILIDVSKSIYFEDVNNIPLSTCEVFNISNETNKKDVHFNEKFKPENKLIQEYYYNSNNIAFLVDNYQNKFYDFLLQKLNFIPIPFIHGLAIILGKSYNLKKVVS